MNSLIELLTHLHTDIKSIKCCVNRLGLCQRAGGGWEYVSRVRLRAPWLAAFFAAGASLGSKREVLGRWEAKPELLSELCQG